MRLTNENYENDVLKLKRKTQGQYNNELWQNVKEREDIEEELGIDLITLFKAMLQGIYYKGAYGTNNYGKIVYKEHPTIIFEIISKTYCFKPTFFDFINLEDYGKTWSIRKEDLE